jgi:hypothetical protein
MATGPQNNLAPQWTTPLVDLQTGYATESWFEFFVRLTTKPPPIVGVTPSGSLFTYMASTDGNLAVSGGTVSSITISRAAMTNIPTGVTSGIIPMSQGDSVTITYSDAPTVNFIPG